MGTVVLVAVILPPLWWGFIKLVRWWFDRREGG